MSRVLLVGMDTAGFLTGLKRGFEDHDYEVSRIGPPDVFDYEHGKASPAILSGRKARFKKSASRFPSWYRLMRAVYGIFVRPLRRLLKLRYVVPVLGPIPAKFDIVVYNHGESLTGGSWEFSYLRRRGVKLIFVFHGSDVRPAYLNGAVWSDGSTSLTRVKKMVKRQTRIVKTAEKYGDLNVCWAGITHFFAKEVCLHEKAGFPLANWRELHDIAANGEHIHRPSSPVRVLHAPSKTAVKGTSFIVDTVEKLKKAGIPLTLQTLTDCPNNKVIEKLQHTDFVIDQVYSDSAAGVFAMEASLLGKPAVVASSDVQWLQRLLGEAAPPTRFISIDDLGAEVTRLATNLDYRNEAGMRAQRHFEDFSKPANAVAIYLDGLNSGYQSTDLVDPLKIVAARGGFAPHEERVNFVTEFVDRFGKQALSLSHNPELEEAVITEYYRKAKQKTGR